MLRMKLETKTKQQQQKKWTSSLTLHHHSKQRFGNQPSLGSLSIFERLKFHLIWKKLQVNKGL